MNGYFQTITVSPEIHPKELKKAFYKGLYLLSHIQCHNPLLFVEKIQELADFSRAVIELSSDEYILKSAIITFSNLINTYTYFKSPETFPKPSKQNPNFIEAQSAAYRSYNSYFTGDLIVGLMQLFTIKILAKERMKPFTDEDDLLELG